ncbi:MAG: hypothetical protein KAS04_00560 [Candidatus Aenigmarchaeota archaeon]|nr:hypothetical protein [Candidatus Aenigmarchaeota archaeon]
MDRRVYILPIVSVLFVIFSFTNPDLSGYIVADSGTSELSADISVSISTDGFIPVDSIVTVYLDDVSSSMKFTDFIEKSDNEKNIVNCKIEQMSYSGKCYTGPYTYILDISEFDIDTITETGNHMIVIEVSYGNFVISRDEHVVDV